MPPAVSPRPLAHRWFFALKPDDITARRIHAFAERELGEGGLLPPERHHVTLALTTDFEHEPPELVAALMRAGDSVSAAPFDLLLDQLSGSARTVALRPSHAVPTLRTLQQRIVAGMAAQGVVLRPDWTFSPHQTLCYRKGPSFQRPVEGFHWAVSAFALVHSLIGLSRHETLREWPLRPAEDPQGRLL